MPPGRSSVRAAGHPKDLHKYHRPETWAQYWRYSLDGRPERTAPARASPDSAQERVQVAVNPLFVLTAETAAGGSTRRGVPLRPIKPDDVDELSRMYHESYAESLPQPPERATGWIDALLAGAEGAHLPEASAVLTGPEGQLTAAIIVTEPAPGSDGEWDAVIAELFTHPDFRRQGLADELLSHCLDTLQVQGRSTVAVTVDSGNFAALAFYLSRDFRRLTDDDA